MGESAWQPIAEPLPKECVLVTNNITARDAYGQMSHVWIGQIIKSSDPEQYGKYIVFNDRDERVRFLTHWAPIPQP